MNTFLQFAQSYDSYNSYSSTGAEGAETAVAAFIIGLYLFFLALSVGAYILTALGLMKIFNKAGVPGWMAWVPFLNNWKLLEIGGQQGFWAVLSIIPVASIVSSVYTYIAMYHVGLKLGKEGVFLLWAIFIPPVWFLWLGFDKSTWNDGSSSAASLHQ